jgi:outer membrane protein assembly factor BamB
MKAKFFCRICSCLNWALQLTCAASLFAGKNWTQFKNDSRHSGDAPDQEVKLPLGLVGTVPLMDAVFTSPVVANGRVFVVDGSGTAYGINAESLQTEWRFPEQSEASNCNNVSSPAYINGFLHFGTMNGSYFVLDAKTGQPRAEIRTGEPIFSSPVVANGRVYFATLGSKVYALEPDGDVLWQ